MSVQGAVAIVFLDALGEDRRTACDEERELAKSVRSGSIRGEGVARNLEAMTTLFDRELLGAGICLSCKARSA